MKNVNKFNSFLKAEVNINRERLNLLNRRAPAVTEFLSKALSPSFVKVERQGSYALRTIIQPVNNGEYDADLLLFLKHDPAKQPADYIRQVYDCLRRDSSFSRIVRVQSRSVAVDYAGDFHLDIVPCIERGGQRCICNRKTKQFEVTDGTGYRDWFNAKTAITHGNLKGAVKLLKYMRDHKGNFEVPSIILTTLVGNSIHESDDRANFRNVPDTLKIVSHRINAFLQANSAMPALRNPVRRQESFNQHWQPADYKNFREKFAIYTGKINAAWDETDRRQSIRKWQELFGGNFGR